jgi:hypothetical protein
MLCQALFPDFNQVTYPVMDLLVVFTLALFHQVLPLRVVYQVPSLVTNQVLSLVRNQAFRPVLCQALFLVLNQVPHQLMDLVVVFTLALFHQVLPL